MPNHLVCQSAVQTNSQPYPELGNSDGVGDLGNIHIYSLDAPGLGADSELALC